MSILIYYSLLFWVTEINFPEFDAGTGIALAGVFLYSRVKRIKAKPKAA